MRWQNSSGLIVAPGSTHSYLIDPPIKYGPADAAGRAKFGQPDQHLLFTFPNGEKEHAWNFHSNHNSLEDAQVAAEAHNSGAGD